VHRPWPTDVHIDKTTKSIHDRLQNQGMETLAVDVGLWVLVKCWRANPNMGAVDRPDDPRNPPLYEKLSSRPSSVGIVRPGDGILEDSANGFGYSPRCFDHRCLTHTEALGNV
jgi:hypothetical protein